MIYAFYSFKGGVGRTFALVHSAILVHALYAAEKRPSKTLALDLDLEAPGLDVYLPVNNRVKGFAHLLRDYTNAHRSFTWLREHLMDYVAPVAAETDQATKGSQLFLMTSGLGPSDPNPCDYKSTMQALARETHKAEGWIHDGRPAEVSERHGFLPQLHTALSEQFGRTFVDSRTGLSGPTFASTVVLGDCLVGCVRLNRANIEGMRLVLGNVLTARAQPTLPLVIVASKVPARGSPEKQRWLKAAEGLVPKVASETGYRDLFPKVVRLPYDESLDLGERRVVTPSGKLNEGYDSESPLFVALVTLVRRLLAEASQSDVLAAKLVEIRFFNNETLGGSSRALPFIVNRIRLEPLDPEHWTDLRENYWRKSALRSDVKKHMDRLITQWRGALSPDPATRHRLGVVLFQRATAFGREEEDGGYSDATEATKLLDGCPEWEEDPVFLAGQVVEELRRQALHARAALEARLGCRLDDALADEYYTRAIQIGEKKGAPTSNVRAARGKLRARMERFEEAVADLDEAIVHAPKSADVSALLVEQAQILGRLGWYLADLRNRLHAVAGNPTYAQTTALAAVSLGLVKRAWSYFWMSTEPISASRLHLESLLYICTGQFERAITAARRAWAYEGEGKTSIVLAVALALHGNWLEAQTTLDQNVTGPRLGNYERAFMALVAAQLGLEMPTLDGVAEPLAALALLRTKKADAIQWPAERARLSCSDQAQWAMLDVLAAAATGKKADSELAAFRKLLRQRPFLGVRLRHLAEFRFYQLPDLPRKPAVAEAFALVDRSTPPRENQISARDPTRRIKRDRVRRPRHASPKSARPPRRSSRPRTG